jgi:hypothetical protein
MVLRAEKFLSASVQAGCRCHHCNLLTVFLSSSCSLTQFKASSRVGPPYEQLWPCLDILLAYPLAYLPAHRS